jgi:DNA-binding response OmpR family regulator
LLILDILMHGRSGFSILGDFDDKNICREIPKILLIILDNPTERIVASVRGVEGYITKPFYPEELINKIEKIFEGRKRRGCRG